MKTDRIHAIERVLDKRHKRGASDKSLIGWLEHLKTLNEYDKHGEIVLNGFIDAIKQTPTPISYQI